MSDEVRVLIVDDSPFICRLMASYLNSAPGLSAAGTAFDGARALELVKQLRPHVVSLDLEMPGIGGLNVLERIMRENPTPVVVVTGVGRHAASATLRAIHIGAVDFVLKYTPGVDSNPELLRTEIVTKLRLAARIKVIRSLFGSSDFDLGDSARQCCHGPMFAKRNFVHVAQSDPSLSRLTPSAELLIIGASTGGPIAVRELLSALPADYPAAILVVQHLPATFTRALAVQLDRQIKLPVKEALDGDRLRSGHVLVAPGDCDLFVRPNARVQLVARPHNGGPCPSIDATMQSAAAIYGSRTTGVVLTGMGCDGALGLAAIRSRGGRTFAQDSATCVVNGMPQHAVDCGVVDHVAPPAEIANLLMMYRNRTLEQQSW
jgi:two-component system chemotaxis response regulator CheB